MNYPKIGGARVFAMGNIIHIVDANGGKPLLFNHQEAREMAKALNTLAEAILPTTPDGEGLCRLPCTNCGQLMVTIGKWKGGEVHICNKCAKGS